MYTSEEQSFPLYRIKCVKKFHFFLPRQFRMAICVNQPKSMKNVCPAHSRHYICLNEPINGPKNLFLICQFKSITDTKNFFRQQTDLRKTVRPGRSSSQVQPTPRITRNEIGFKHSKILQSCTVELEIKRVNRIMAIVLRGCAIRKIMRQSNNFCSLKLLKSMQGRPCFLFNFVLLWL